MNKYSFLKFDNEITQYNFELVKATENTSNGYSLIYTTKDNSNMKKVVDLMKEYNKYSNFNIYSFNKFNLVEIASHTKGKNDKSVIKFLKPMVNHIS